jgi:hypothetical protein
VPHGRLGFTATRWPGLTLATSAAPTRATVPAISWPRIIGSFSRTVPKPPSIVIVQVRAADAAGLDAHFDIARPKRRYGNFLDAKILSAHEALPRASRSSPFHRATSTLAAPPR